MPKKQTHRKKGWHALHIGHRLSVLGCVMAMSGGALIAMLQTQAATSTVGMVVSSAILIDVIAIPEKRIPASGNNSTHLTIEVRDVGSPVALNSTTVTTGSGGAYSGVTLQLTPGTYDVVAKGYSHLRRKKGSVALGGNVTIDFTDGGTNKLMSGDVNSTDGDNKVNGIDLSIIVAGLLSTTERLDVNRDGLVNGIDLTNSVTNLNITGD